MRWLHYVIVTLAFILGLTLQFNTEDYSIQPIGHVVKNAGKVKLEILAWYRDALLGLSEFSHVFVFYWFNRERLTGKKSHTEGSIAGEQRKPSCPSFCVMFAILTKSDRIDRV